jgi:hypothetical protein
MLSATGSVYPKRGATWSAIRRMSSRNDCTAPGFQRIVGTGPPVGVARARKLARTDLIN